MDVRVRWSLPMERDDGSPMALAEIRGVRLQISADGQNWGNLRTADQLPPQVSEYIQRDLEAGTWHFRAYVVDMFDQESDPLVGSITLTPARPGALAELVIERA